MSNKRARRRFPLAKKVEILAQLSQKTPSQVAADNDITPAQLRTWRKQPMLMKAAQRLTRQATNGNGAHPPPSAPATISAGDSPLQTLREAHRRLGAQIDSIATAWENFQAAISGATLGDACSSSAPTS